MAATVIPLKNSREAPKASRSSMETMIVSAKDIATWRVPPFQRPVRINDKVRMLAEELKADGCAISGILTLGKVSGDPAFYIVDGQHRLEGFKLSGLEEALADVRICRFESMADMAEEFVRLNSALVRMRPDDILRGLEPSVPALRTIRRQCEFVGYGNIRRTDTRSPILSMSAVLRSWAGSNGETPTSGTSGVSAGHLAAQLDDKSTQDLTVFLLTAHTAWGSDPEYYRLWGSLNLTMCMWLFRRLVLERDRGVKRYAILNIAQFKQCLMSLSAANDYVDWLTGRKLGDRDRSPCYARIKTIFVRRLMEEAKDKKRVMLPQVAWASV